MTDPVKLPLDDTLQRAYSLLVEGRREELLTLMERAVERFPAAPEIRLLYATALVPWRPEQAVLEAARAIELDVNDAGRLTRAARLMLDLGQVQAARSYAARATQLAPSDFLFKPELTGICGVLAGIRGEDVLAEEALRAAHAAEPGREMFARDLARFLDERGRSAEALEVISRTIAAGGEGHGLRGLSSEIDARRRASGGD